MGLKVNGTENRRRIMLNDANDPFDLDDETETVAPRKTKRRFLTRLEIIKAVPLIIAHTTEPVDGIVSYLPEWNDARVAREIGPTISEGQIRHLRQETRGRLYARSAEEKSLEARVATLERQLAALAARLGEALPA
jgi:hypothetical protein